MSRPKNTVPSYKRHKPTNTARCWVNGQWVSLGKYNSPESRDAYARIVDAFRERLLVTTTPGAGRQAVRDITVTEVYRDFWKFAQQHYRRADGTTTSELPQYAQTFRLVLSLFPELPAIEFGPLALKAVRQKMVEVGWSRKLINQRIGRVKRVFKWAVGEQLIPASVLQALSAVAGLQAGRTDAAEYEPIAPVGEAAVRTTQVHLNRYVRGLVEFQWLTGCRPGEACAVRRCDVETTDGVWLYRPVQFKTRHRGATRVIAVGPRAQALLREFFTPDACDYLFSPAKATAEFHAARTANRKTPLYRSHAARNAANRKAAPKRVPAARYTITAYEHAVSRACDRAFPVPARLAPCDGESRSGWWARLTLDEQEHVRRWQREHRWHPNQLRHAFATRVRAGYDLEAAQVALGHARADVTQVYAEKNQDLAAQVALDIG